MKRRIKIGFRLKPFLSIATLSVAMCAAVMVSCAGDKIVIDIADFANFGFESEVR